MELGQSVAARVAGVSASGQSGLTFCNGVGADFQAPQHEIHQPLPGLEIEIGRQGLEVRKEFAARSHGRADQAVGRGATVSLRERRSKSGRRRCGAVK